MDRKEDNNPITYKIGGLIVALLKKFKFISSHKREIEILKNRGLKLGKNVIISSHAILDRNFAYLISIGDNSIISAGVRILAHDSTLFLNNGGYSRLGLVVIKENCIIGSDSLILPGVTIGPNVIVAAGSLVNKDIPANSCVSGVPARFYSKFEDVIVKNKNDVSNSYIVDSKNLYFGKCDKDVKDKILEKLNEGKQVYTKDLYELLKDHNYFDN